MLNMPINKIRRKIQIYPGSWVNMHSTNCYAYAMGLDIPQYKICEYAYQPGTMSETANIAIDDYFTREELIDGMYGDFKLLDISCRQVTYDEPIEDDEWKIALLFSGVDDTFMDFHFLKQGRYGVWTHKNGFDGEVSRRDYSGRIITNPEIAYLPTYKFNSCYALKLNR